MRRRTLLAAGGAALLPGVARAQAPHPNGSFAFSCTAKGLAGLALQGEDGAILDPDWAWHLGSNTKAMTAALYARLVEQGRCRWGSMVPQLFPSIRVHPAWTDISVEHWMGHTSGLSDALVTPAWLLARHTDRAPPRAQRRALVKQLLAVPPPHTPGQFAYGNLNYVVLGAAIEQAMDTSWEAVMAAELFAPLGLRGAGFGPPPVGVWGRMGSTLVPMDPHGIADNPAVLWPAGGVHLPPASYARWLQLFLADGGPLLRSDTLRRLLTPALPTGRYAGGWALDGEVLSHSGSNTLWYVTAVIDRAAGRAYAAGTNQGGAAGERIVREAIERLRTAVIPASAGISCG